jgi:hypothetical protein
MNRRFLLISVLFMVMAIVPPAQSAPRDYASLRKAADAFAEKSQPGSKLWRIDLTGSYDGGSLQIQEGEFHYFLLGKPSTSSPSPSGLDLLSAKVKSLEGMHLPQIDRGSDSETLGLHVVEKWQMAPVPGNILSPDDALRRLNRPLRGDPYHVRISAEARRAGHRGLLDLKLVQVGAAVADSSRNMTQWGSLADALGVRRGDVDVFARTAPLGKWIWWTVVEQDRPYPGSDPRGPGTPRRVREYIYIDAVSGKATSHCQGPSPSPIPCQEEAAPGIPPRADSLLGVTGEVKSASAGRLVIVTDRDMSASLRKGTEMTFELNQPHLRSFNLRSGDYVTIKYENQSGRMIAHEITLRPLGYR